MVLLSAIALVLSCMLCVHALSGSGLIGCSAGTSCNEVLGSRWSYIFGRIPVSGLSALVYIAMIVCLLFRRSFDDDPQFARWIDRGMIVIAGAILGAAVWFIWLQKNMIRAFCPYCMTAHVCGIILSVLVLFRSRERLSWRISSLLAGLALSAGLMGIQLLTTPRTAFERGFVQEALPEMSPEELPLVGNPSAENVITLLFDYRCSHCQKLHGMLDETLDILNDGSEDYAVVMCPVPISMACNPYIRVSEDRFKGSCELDRLALAVWRTDRSAFAEFDRWLFSTDENQSSGWWPREPEDAYEKAGKLIGVPALEKALADPWIDSYLSDVFEIFGRTSTAEHSSVPRFIDGSGNWLVPDADDPAGLAAVLRNL